MKRISVANYKKDNFYGSIVKAVKELLMEKNEISAVDLLKKMSMVDPVHCERWKKGQVPYFEKIVQCNLSKTNRILRVFRMHAHDLKMGSKIVKYSRKGGIPLRFSKTGDQNIEDAYARHFYIIGSRDKFLEKKLNSEPVCA
jgi:hypothetical protein